MGAKRTNSKPRQATRNKPTGQAKASQPDQTEKLLEDWCDVFADIINVLVYGGEKRVEEKHLVDGPTASRYKAAAGPYHEKDRDICKEDIRGKVHFAVWGLENQTDICRIMPVRCMGYDYSAYERIIKRLQAENKQDGNEAKYTEGLRQGQTLWPVVTIVLYFGIKKWDAPTTLWELAHVPDELKPFVPNYHINLVQVAFLDDDVIQKFTSDFQTIAKFFCAKRLGKEKEIMYNDQRAWDHVAEMLEFFHTFTGDKRYREYKAFLIERSRKGEVKMCTLLDAFEKQGIEQGLEKGLEKGIPIGHYQMADRYADINHTSVEDAMKRLGFSDKEKAGYYAWKTTAKNRKTKRNKRRTA